VQDFFNQTFFGNTILDYLIFVVAVAASMVAVTFLKRFILKIMKRWALRTETKMDDQLVRALRHYLMPIIYYSVLLLDLQILTLSPDLANAANVVGMVLAAILGPMFASSVILFFLNIYWEKQNKEVSAMALRWIGMLIKIFIWAIALLLLLENLGVDVTALIAGLGIGGVAFAFAAQAVLEDVFSCFAILFDKPFEVGDFIVVGNMAGTVEDTGIKTTRIRSLDGEQLIFANKDITNSRVQNYKRMEMRRVAFGLGVTYDTPVEKLKEIPGLLKEIIVSMEKTTFDRAHFTSYGDYSLNFRIVYYILSNDYNTYRDIHQEVNFRIKEEFEKREIEFAFPTQTVYYNAENKDPDNTAEDMFR
jgi:small-conductance mechanosensitive channel